MQDERKSNIAGFIAGIGGFPLVILGLWIVAAYIIWEIIASRMGNEIVFVLLVLYYLPLLLWRFILAPRVRLSRHFILGVSRAARIFTFLPLYAAAVLFVLFGIIFGFGDLIMEIFKSLRF